MQPIWITLLRVLVILSYFIDFRLSNIEHVLRIILHSIIFQTVPTDRRWSPTFTPLLRL